MGELLPRLFNDLQCFEIAVVQVIELFDHLDGELIGWEPSEGSDIGEVRLIEILLALQHFTFALDLVVATLEFPAVGGTNEVDLGRVMLVDAGQDRLMRAADGQDEYGCHGVWVSSG